MAYGKEGEATEFEIVAAAEAANAHKFISSLQQVEWSLFLNDVCSSNTY